MKRNFNEWFATFIDSMAIYDYYTNFNIVYRNINKLKTKKVVYLNIRVKGGIL